MRTTSQRRIIIIAVLGLSLVALGSLGRLSSIGGALGVVFSPLTRMLHVAGTGIANNVGVVGSARNLASDNAKLRKENADLRAALATASAGSAELAAIKKQLGLRELAGKRLVPADVVSTQPDSYRAFVTINRGSKDGLAAGMVVVVDGTLVGTINQVGELSSKVLVVTDPTFKVTGQVLAGGNGATGTVRGSIGGGLLMEKIPQDQKLSVGDTVITSGLGGDIIKGYSLGTVQSVARADNGVFQSARLSTPVQIGRLQTVFVVAN
jgi:rod shape-determining protein MreC